METKPKSQCPYCDKSFAKVNSHITKTHKGKWGIRKVNDDYALYNNSKQFAILSLESSRENCMLNGHEPHKVEIYTNDASNLLMEVYYKEGEIEPYLYCCGRIRRSIATMRHDVLFSICPIVWV